MACFVLALGMTGLISCKKDRQCECTLTSTDTKGTVRTYPAEVTTLKDISKSEAKSYCQKSTSTYVNEGGATSTEVNDCKLK